MPAYLREIIYAASFLVGAALLAAVAYKVLSRLAQKHDTGERSLLRDLFCALRFPTGLVILFAGTYLALEQVAVLRPHVIKGSEWLSAATTLAIIIGLSRTAGILIGWYGHKTAESGGLPGQVGLLRKIATIAIWTLGCIQILSILGKPIGTLIASLGIASLAVGLALQDTIANIFAGFYIVADRSIRSGDYIKIDEGLEGYVETVGWRNTRIRLWANNIVLIPNNKLIQSVITNMTLPNPALSVYTYCGVGYESDLEHVERVAVDVANKVIREFPGGDLTFEPVVRFKEFADSNINFVTVFRAVEVAAQYRLQHEFVKALHQRFKEENIEISFPIRKLVWDSPQAFPPQS